MRNRIILSAIAVILLMGMNHSQANDRGVVKEEIEIDYDQLPHNLLSEDLVVSEENQPKGEIIRFINNKGETFKEIDIHEEVLLEASTRQTPILRKAEFLMEIHGVSYYLVNE